MVLRLRTNAPEWGGWENGEYQANCLDNFTEHFDNDAHDYGSKYPQDALGTCNNEVCPLRQQCLDFALLNNEQYGVWGGMTEEDRMALRRKFPAKKVDGEFVPREEWVWHEPSEESLRPSVSRADG